MSPLDARPVAGDVAPHFALRDADGVERSLTAAKGSWLALYFYPKDDTPGCTIEACEFRDAERALQEAGALVWGVSPDDQESKAAFRDKFSLNFPILADVGHTVAEAYGVWGERTVGERTFTGDASRDVPDQPERPHYACLGERHPHGSCGGSARGDHGTTRLTPHEI